MNKSKKTIKKKIYNNNRILKNNNSNKNSSKNKEKNDEKKSYKNVNGREELMVEEKQNKEWAKEKRRRKKGREKNKGGEGFWNLKEGWVRAKEKEPHIKVWFRLTDLGSSQNFNNSLIHKWCICGCWFT